MADRKSTDNSAHLSATTMGYTKADLDPKVRPRPPKTPWPVEVSRDGTVAADVPCRGCAYNLRTQRVTGTCPECGTAVRASVRGDWLVFSDPAWIERVARGASLFLGFGLSAFGCLIVFGSLGWHPFFDAVAKIAGLVCIVGIVTGAWWLTAADPSGVGERPRSWMLRHTTRTLLIAGFLTLPLEYLRRQFPPASVIGPMIYVLAQATHYARFAGIVCLLWYLRDLAIRMADEGLAKALAFVAWLMPGCIVAIQLTVHLLPSGRITACVALPIFFGLLGSVFLMIALLNALRSDLKFQAQMSRQLWPRAPREPATPPPA